MNDSKELFYDSISEDFDKIMNMYDTHRRAEVIFDEFLKDISLSGKRVLDGGCGTGYFSGKAKERGADIIPLDISRKLVKLTQKKNNLDNGICASLLSLPFKDNMFDVVISSDVIEHTPNPYASTQELIRILKPGGLLCLTVPNRTTWYFSLLIANALGIRDYKGFENWVHFYTFKNYLKKQNMVIHDYKGIHLFPFVIKTLNPLLRKIDTLASHRFGSLFVNIAAFAKKT